MWIKLAQLPCVPAGSAYEAEVDGRHYALFNVDGTIHACEGICTHAHAHLADGYLEGEEIECPLHASKFNVRTGQALCAPAKKDLAVYPVKIVDGDIHIEVADDAPPV